MNDWIATGIVSEPRMTPARYSNCDGACATSRVTRAVAAHPQALRFVLLFAAIISVCGSGVVQAGTPTADEIMELSGFSSRQKKAVLSGKVVTVDVERIASNEVVALLAVHIPIPFAEVFDSYEDGEDFEISPRHLALGQVDPAAPTEGWEKALFLVSEVGEVEDLTDASPGLNLNLSSKEFSELQEGLAGVDEAERVERLSEIYRGFLQSRMQAYIEQGLGGVAPYARGKGGETSPADELRILWNADTFILEHFPDFHRALDTFPKNQPPEMHHRFFWLKQHFESKWSSRPAFVLEHDAWYLGKDAILISSRQFFVGHSYNANQGVSVILPHGDGVIVFYLMDVTSDLAARYVSWIALPIAQQIMSTELENQFKRLRHAEIEAESDSP